MQKYQKKYSMKIFLNNKYFVDFFASVMFFTRIPIHWPYFSDKPPDLTRATWSFPLVGFLIGIISGIVGELCIYLNLTIFLSCTVAIGFSVIITGAFHEDGLADMADGFGAGGSPEKINQIMHDSRLGTYGMIALSLGLLIRLGIIMTLVDLGYSLVIILSTGFASGKLSILFIRNFFNPSNFAKTGSIIEYVPLKSLLIACMLWVVIVVCFFPLFGIFLGISLTAFVIFKIGNMSKRNLGGISGDILGATAFLTELAFMFGLIIYLSIKN